MDYNLTNRVFGHLTVIAKLETRSSQGYVQWRCKCACGKLKVYATKNLLHKTQSVKTCRNCRDSAEHKEAYQSWMSAKRRCNDKNSDSYYSHGARGITFSAEWEDFKYFLRDMGDPPKDFITGERLTLDRIDNDGNYEKDNCRWATRSEQELNKQRRIKNSVCQPDMFTEDCEKMGTQTSP